MSDTARVLRELADDYRRQASMFEFAQSNSPGEATCSTLLDVQRDLLEKAAEVADESSDYDEIVNDLWNTIQILLSRYPGCETVITEKEMVERSSVGVVVRDEIPGGGFRLKVRQR